jgi:tetratricopeptide (TPR) repeat protein
LGFGVQLVITLRFGSEKFTGEPEVAKQVFLEAKQLFVIIGKEDYPPHYLPITSFHRAFLDNKRGIGASLNNLAVSEAALGNFTAAEMYCNDAIVLAEEILEDTLAERAAGGTVKMLREVLGIQKVVSDRKGNLAMIYLRQSRYREAFSLIQTLIQEDLINGYVRGQVAKRGLLSLCYMMFGDIANAERSLERAMQVICNRSQQITGRYEVSLQYLVG